MSWLRKLSQAIHGDHSADAAGAIDREPVQPRSRKACSELELALLAPVGDCAPYLASLADLAWRPED